MNLSRNVNQQSLSYNNQISNYDWIPVTMKESIPVFESDGFDEGGLDGVLDGRGELRPVAGDLLAEEHGGELADVGGLGSAHVMDERRDRLRILEQPLNLILGLPPGVVVGHLELDQQQLQRLRHGRLLPSSLFLLLFWASALNPNSPLCLFISL